MRFCAEKATAGSTLCAPKSRKSDANGNMLLRHSPDAPWQHFDQNASVFAAAKRQGWGTAIAGWIDGFLVPLD